VTEEARGEDMRRTGSLAHNALENVVDQAVLVQDISVGVDQLRCEKLLDSLPNRVAREPTSCY
jgi:hypothetical protein